MSEYEGAAQEPRGSGKRWGVVGFVIVTAGFALLYRAARGVNSGHTSLMFIGIPFFVSLLLAILPRAKSATGGIVKGITFALCIMAPIMGEGYLCILMAAPLFYLVGIGIGASVDWERKHRRRNNGRMTLGCCALVLLPMSLEGVTPALTFNRLQTVAATRIVEATPAEVEAALARSPSIGTPLPGFLSIGFPRPLAARGDGLSVGALRIIHFSGAEGDPPGDLVTRITTVRPGFVRSETVSDTSKLTQWVRWESSEVTWRPIDATHTQVTWRIRFERQLDPAWYFIPWERFAVREAAGYMIQANATPAGR
jgi:hypothetical protein